MESSEELQSLVARLMAVTAATAEVVQVLIATHPQPAQLQQQWQQRLADTVDTEMDTPPFEHPEYRAAYVENMTGISQVIDRAARHTGENSR